MYELSNLFRVKLSKNKRLQTFRKLRISTAKLPYLVNKNRAIKKSSRVDRKYERSKMKLDPVWLWFRMASSDSIT